MYRSSRNTAKNSSAAPRSRWTTTIPSAIAHIATIGARYGSGGRRDRPDPGRFLDEQRPVLGEVAREEHDEDHLQQLRRLAADRAERERQALAVDLGPEDERQQQQGDADRRPRVLVEPQPAVGADDDGEGRGDADRQHEPDELDVGRGRASTPKNRWTTRSCGSRSMSSRLMPPSSPTAGSRTWSVRRPVRTWARWAASSDAEVDREVERLGRREPGRRRRLVRSPGELERDAADQDRGRDDRRGGEPRASVAGADLAEDPGQRRSVCRHRRGRSSRNRTWPTWSSSPYPSGETPSTGCPLTNVPFVLFRSSTYQVRPRNVSTACSAEAN